MENLITELETGRVTLIAPADTLVNKLEMYEFEKNKPKKKSVIRFHQSSTMVA